MAYYCWLTMKYVAEIDPELLYVKIVEKGEGYNAVRAAWFSVLIEMPIDKGVSFCLWEWILENLESGHLDGVKGIDLQRY